MKVNELFDEIYYLLFKIQNAPTDGKSLWLLKNQIDCLKLAIGEEEILLAIEQKKKILQSKNRQLSREKDPIKLLPHSEIMRETAEKTLRASPL